MNVLMMTLMYPEDQLAEAMRLSRDGVQNQINNYQRAFLSGMREQLAQGEALTVFNALPVGAFPMKYKRPYIRAGWHDGHTIRELGCFNLPWFKQRGRAHRMTKALRAWTQQSPQNRSILLYTLYLPFMQAIEAVKRDVPDLRATVIVTDLPNELGISSGRRGLMQKAEYRMGDERIRLCEAMDGFVLLTEAMAEALPIQGKQRMVLEGLILPDNESAPAQVDPTAPPAVLYTGTLNRELGIAELLKAFEAMPDVQLWLCGGGDMADEARRASEHCRNIRYEGIVPRERALELQAKATVLINPRTPEGAFTRYSFPSKTLEYLRSGKPVLCYKLEGIPSDYDAYLHYIQEIGASGIRSAVRALLATPVDALSQKALAGREYVLTHKNPRVQCARVMALMRSLTETGDK